MKKFSLAILVLSLALSFCACTNEKDDSLPESSVSESSVSDSSVVSESAEPSHEGEKLLLHSEKHWSNGSLSETVTYSYDNFGVLTEKITEQYTGRIITEKYTYDSEGRLISIVKSEGDNKNETTWTYNENGLLTKYDDGAGSWEKYTYDAQGRIATCTKPDTVNYGEENTELYYYDEDGNYTITGGKEDYVVVFYYTKDDVKYKMTVNGDVTEEGKLDENGNLISYTYYSDDGMLYCGYVYDENNCLIKGIQISTRADSQIDHFSEEIHEYDEFGNLVKRSHTLSQMVSDGTDNITNNTFEMTYKFFPVEDKK